MFIYFFTDETSYFDPKKTAYNYGGDYWEREYKCRLPDRAKKWSQKKIDEYIDKHSEDKNFWIE